MYYKIVLHAALIVAMYSNNLYSQNIVDDIASSDDIKLSTDLFEETIKTISRSQKIFIITNTNQMLNKGDFITLTFGEGKPITRALVAKNHDNLTGIKILKIYSLKRWGQIKKDVKVQILKGDDSRLFIKKPEKKEISEEKIEGEEDLYNDVMIEEDIDFLNKDNRHIKPDNIVGVAAGQLQFQNTINNNTESHIQLFAQWAYQIADNFWAEGIYGRTLIDGLPAAGSQTLLNNFVGRIKYTFKAPLYSYILPYIGFQQVSVTSPDAGRTTDATLAAKELALVDSLARTGIVLGFSIYRRLVPGWFIKADIGSDDLNVGFAIEF